MQVYATATLLVWLLCGAASSSGQSLTEYLLSGQRLQNGAKGPSVVCNATVSHIQVFKERAYVTLPRDKPGVPFSLGLVVLNKERSAKISALPSLELNKVGDCGAIQNAVDVQDDGLRQLWVLDDGLANSPWQEPSRRCPPKLVVINIDNNKVSTANLSNLVLSKSKLANLVVDISPAGEKYVYISDLSYGSLIVFDALNWNGRRVNLPTEFSSSRILNIALLHESHDATYLYYTYAGLNKLFKINSKYLYTKNATDNAVQVGTVNPEIVFLGSTYRDAIFFNYKNNSDVYKWNVKTNFNPKNFQRVEVGTSSKIPTAVAPDQDNKVWVMWSDLFKYHSHKCFEQRIKLL